MKAKILGMGLLLLLLCCGCSGKTESKKDSLPESSVQESLKEKADEEKESPSSASGNEQSSEIEDESSELSETTTAEESPSGNSGEESSLPAQSSPEESGNSPGGSHSEALESMREAQESSFRAKAEKKTETSTTAVTESASGIELPFLPVS